MLQFRKTEHDSDLFPNITFEKVKSIYIFDEELRNLLRKYLEKIEILFRTSISYYFSNKYCTTPPYNQHYDENFYENKSGFKEVKACFIKQLKYYKDSLIVIHHNKSYSGKMPLWVIVEFMSFSNLSKYFKCLKQNDKDTISKEMGTGRETLSNHLHCLTVLRNKCAHGARLYNTIFRPPAKFGKQFLKTHKEFKNNTFFAYFLVLIKRLTSIDEKKECVNKFYTLLDKYISKDEYKYLGLTNNFKEIISKELI